MAGAEPPAEEPDPAAGPPDQPVVLPAWAEASLGAFGLEGEDQGSAPEPTPGDAVPPRPRGPAAEDRPGSVPAAAATPPLAPRPPATPPLPARPPAAEANPWPEPASTRKGMREPTPPPPAPDPAPVPAQPPAAAPATLLGRAAWSVRTLPGPAATRTAAPGSSPAAPPAVPTAAPTAAPPRPHGVARPPVATPTPPRAPKPAARERSAALRVALPVALALAAAAGAVAALTRFWVDVTVGRDLTLLPVLRLQDAGTLSLAALWHPIEGSRILAPELVVFGLLPAVHLDTRAEMLVGILLLIATAFALFAVWGEPGRWRWWWFLPAVPLVCSLVQLPTLLLGFRFGDALALAGVAAALAMLNRDQLELGAFLFAVLGAGIATCSSFEGLFVWPAGLVVLAGRQGSWIARAGWALCGAGAAVAVLWHLDLAGLGGPGLPVFWDQPGRALGFLLTSIGSVLPAPGGGIFGVWQAEVLGGAILLAAVLVACCWRLRRPDDRRLAGVSGVAAFAILVDLAETAGHAQFGVATAIGSRYLAVNLLLLAAVYLGVVTALGGARALPPTAAPAPAGGALGRRGGALARGRAASATIATGAAVALVLAAVALGVPAGLRTGARVRTQRLRSAAVLADYRTASAQAILRTLYPSAPRLRADAAFLAANRLGIFAGPTR